MGTDPSTPPPGDPPADPPPGDPPPDPPAGGDDPGGQAETVDVAKLKATLAAERRARAAAEREAAKLRDEHATDADKAIAAARDEGRREALGQVTGRMVEAEVRAAAAGKLADPADAVRLIDLTGFVGDDGDIDAKAIAAAVDELVETKPYLRAAAGGEGKANGSHPAPQGTRPGPALEGDGDAFLRRVVRGT
jgi:hypothetical protein